MFNLPSLDFEYGALDPYIDEATMKIHHTKHHQGYIDKLNAALEDYPEFSKMTIEDLLSSLESLPSDIRSIVTNNGGGHFNHSMFWKSMSPNQNTDPTSKIEKSINTYFGDFSNFQSKFTEAAVNRFGSGWAWLIDSGGKLEITSTANQDCPISSGTTPILGLDVWEHAYYLKYQNRRPDYIAAWWNVINWNEVERRLV